MSNYDDLTVEEVIALLRGKRVEVQPSTRGLYISNAHLGDLPAALITALRKREQAICAELRREQDDVLSPFYEVRVKASQDGPLEPGEERAWFNVPGIDYVVEVRRSQNNRQYASLLLSCGRRPKRRFVGADLFPLPDGTRRVEDDFDAELVDLLRREGGS